jgi:hypothetical protein
MKGAYKMEIGIFSALLFFGGFALIVSILIIDNVSQN